MSVSAGNLNSLLGVTFSGNEFTGLSVQGFTSGGTPPQNETLTSLTATSTGLSYAAGITSYTIVGVSNSLGTVTVEYIANENGQNFDAGTIVFYPLAFTPNSILFSLNSASTIAELLNTGDDVSGNLAMASPASISAGSTATFQSDATFNASIPCFVIGTHIRTLSGDTAVEELAVGGCVVTASGEASEVRWIGHRHIDCTRHARPEDVWPVRVRPGAFGEGRPAQDLWLSPDHAVFVAGNLIPVRYLVNGRSIALERRTKVTYFHIELARHDVLLAEGLPCESYLDTGNRGAFANGGDAVQLQPDFALRIWEAKACAPLVLEGPELDAVKRRLLRRTASIGYRMTTDSGLRVLADGGDVQAMRDGPRWHVRLPEGTRQVQLLSRVWVPAHTRPAETDTRILGIALGRLWLDGRQAALDSPSFGAGWHDPEARWRWTSGDGVLAVAGVRDLELEVAMTGTYWRDEQNEAIQAA